MAKFSGFFGPLQFIFLCTMVKYCAVALCRKISKDQISDIFGFLQGPMSGSRRSKHLCSVHFKESDIDISISCRNSVRSDCPPTIFDPTKYTTTVSSRSKEETVWWKTASQDFVVSLAAVLSIVTQRPFRGALRDDAKNGLRGRLSI